MIKKNKDDKKDGDIAALIAGKKRSADEADGGGKSDEGEESSDAKKAKLEDFELDAKTKEIVLKDTKNEKLWKECLEFKAKFKLEWLDNVEQHFSCVVCCDLIYMPITTDCAHNICEGCYLR